MKTPNPRIITSAMLLTLGLQAPLGAQTTVETDETTVTLSPFVVNTETDNGYIAVDALAGGRTNTPIKLTPASMSSLTRAFLDDLGIQDVRDALKWAPNVVEEDPGAGKGFGGQAFNDWSFNFRGSGAGQQGGPGPTRNYFSFFENPDAYNLERIEFTRGPNSILFGIGTVGGTLSTYTKIPRIDKSFYTPSVIADSNGGLRIEADLNFAASQNFAVRVNAVHDDSRGWRQNDEGKKDGVTVAMLYKFNDKTSFRIEVEGVKKEQTLISSTVADKLSGWDGQTASQTWGAAPTGGTSRTIPMQNAGAWGDWLNPFWVYIPNLNGSPSLMGWAGGYASSSNMTDVGAALNMAAYPGWYASEVKLPWEATYSSTADVLVRPSKDWTYGHGIVDVDYNDLTAFLDHRFSENLDASLSYYRFNTDRTAKDYEGTGGAAIDINKQLPNGSANPNYGKAFADFFLSKQDQTRSVDEYRAQVNYHFETDLFGMPLKQLFGFSGSQRQTKISARQYLGQVGNGTTISNPADWVQNMIWGRIYFDEPNQVMNAPEVVNGRQVAYLPKADGYWFDFDDTFDLTSFAIFSHTRMLDDKLAIALGARTDSYDEHVVSLRRGPNLTDQIVDESKDGNTLTAGAIYYFGAVGVFANYSENLMPPNAGSQPYISGDRPSPEKGKGLDYGFRLSTDDGKYYATISRYDTQSEGRNVENPIGIRGLWQAYNLAKGLGQDTGYGSLAYSDTTSLDVTGYELEITANPTSNIRLQASYSIPDTSVVNFYPMVRAHVAENLALWNAQVAATTDATLQGNLRNSIASVQDALVQTVEGSPQQGSVDYTASVFANYTFDDDTLKGLSFGAGAAFTGQRYLATYEGDRYYGDSITTATAVVAYRTKLGNADVTLQLNVDNVFDANDPIITSYHWGYADSSGRHAPDGYYFQNPRTFKLSARFTF